MTHNGLAALIRARKIQLPLALIACGQVAQLVEQGIENPRVGGSIPPLATIFSMLACTMNPFMITECM